MGKLIDLTGQRFGRLVALEYYPAIQKWHCQCDCGNTAEVRAANLRNLHTRSCGCLSREMKMAQMRGPDLTGQRFGRLLVLEKVRLNQWNKAIWNCQCDCGNLTEVPTGSLRSGETRSCGCLMREQAAKNLQNVYRGSTPARDAASKINVKKAIAACTKHGHSAKNSPYRYMVVCWRDLIDRCTNPNSKSYKYYGERSIGVCKEWQESYMAFFNDMGPRPSVGYSIDRIDNDGNYEPSNCRWATRSQQARNQRKKKKNSHKK